MRNLSVATLTFCGLFLAACSDSSGPKVGPLTTIAIKAGGDNQNALAGTVVPGPIVLTPTDNAGHTIPGETATFAVIAGGGTIANTTGTVNADGTITAPAWTLGKSVVPQQMQVTIGGKTQVINATVKTNYNIDVRFFGAALSTDHKALFTNAAARIRAIVVGALPTVSPAGIDPSGCGVTGVTSVGTASFNSLIIYASIDSIDGQPKGPDGNILAQSGPCYYFGDGDFRTILGVMSFDSADIKDLAASGDLQTTITHEMIHVLGFGIFWDASGANLLINDSTPAVAYTGAGAVAGCKTFAPITCASSVPVEGTQGGPGTLYSHWTESTFHNELMTGFLNSGVNPLSVMTVGSIQDLGYTVNLAGADPYTPPSTTSFRSSIVTFGNRAAPTAKWERRPLHMPRPLPTGRVSR